MKAIKTFLLMATMTLILMFFGNLLGGRNGVGIALLLSVGMNFFSYWYSDKIILSMYRAQPVEEGSRVYEITQRVARRAELPMPKVYMINESQPNAFATGRNPENSAVAVTRGLVEILDENELAGVIGHELGHINNRDILIGTMAASLAGAITYLVHMAKWSAIFGGRRSREGSPFALIATMILAPLAAMIVQMAISRTREYKADEYGARVSGHPLYLARALRKLSNYRREPNMKLNPATSHLFIVAPFKGKDLSSLFSTHPRIEVRIKKLEEMAEGGY